MQGDWQVKSAVPLGRAAWSRIAAIAAGLRRRVGHAVWLSAALFGALLLDPGFLSIGDATRRLLCLFTACVWMLGCDRATHSASASERWRAAAMAAVGGAGVLLLPQPAGGVALAFLYLASAWWRGGTAAAIAVAAGWAIVALTTWRALVDLTAIGWAANEALAAAGSRLISVIGGRSVNLGADIGGLPIVIAFAAAALSSIIASSFTPERRLRPAGACAVALAGSLLVGVLANAILTHIRPESPSAVDIGARHLFLVLAFLLASVALPVTAVGQRPSLPSIAMPRGAVLPCLIAGICGLLCLGIWMRRETPIAGKRVGIHNDSSTPWQMSATAGYGGTIAATLGDCMEYLTAFGCRPRQVAGTLTPETLATLDVLILPTPSRPFSAAEQDAVRQFVGRGGGLMALAEHTDLFGVRRHLQPLLHPVGIRVNNDSALAVAGESWGDAIAARPHPVAPSSASPDRHGVAIGASLSLSPPARPLLVGRTLFADPAAPGGELGDLRYERPERLGDAVVAATSNYGDGRVLVFGDPSPLMNYPLHSTDALLRRSIAWLSGSSQSYGGALLLGFLLCGSLTLLLTRGRPLSHRLLVALLTAPLAQMLLPTAAVADRVAYPEGKAALIDTSHREALATNDAFTSSTAGLARVLRRAGYLPSRLERFDENAVAKAGALILVSPTRDLSAREARAIDRMLARGGTLLVALGWNEQPPVPVLMRYLRVAVRPTPLGPVTSETRDGIANFPAGWALQPEDGAGYRALCSRWGHPVLVEGRRGDGRILVVGDTEVLLGERLEGHEQFDAGNIALFQKLLRRPSAVDSLKEEVQ